MIKKVALLLIASLVLSTNVSAQGFTRANGAQYARLRTVNNSNIYKVKANPELGFNFDFYLSVPSPLVTAKTNRLLVCSIASGPPHDDMSLHEKAVVNGISGGWESWIAKALGSPLLMPVFPRSESQSEYYTHVLDIDSMQISKKDPRYRLDMQLIAMIDEALSYLGEQGNLLDRKVLIAGFSASGFFGDRFIFMHPDRVAGIGIGGVAGMPMLPLEKYENRTLNYPLGVADLKKITGMAFDKTAYESIPKMVFMGESDTNDLFKIDNGEDRNVQANRQFGSEVKKRWDKVRTILESTDDKVQTITYLNTSHKVTQEIARDIASFFIANQGDAFFRIIPSLPNE